MEAFRRGGLWTLTIRKPGTFGWVDGASSGSFTAHLPASESDTEPRTVPGMGGGEAPGLERRFETTSLVPWLALVVLGLMILEWRLWNGRFTAWTKPTLALLRLAAVGASVLALVGFSPVLLTTDRALVLLFDVSDSLGPGLVENERASALALLSTLGSHDRVALVAFASAPRVLSGPVPRDQAWKALETVGLDSGSDTGSTNLQAALTTGAQLLEGQPGSRSQYLFSDGRANQGGDTESLTGKARAYPVSAVPLGRPLSGVEGLGLDLPASARPGERVPLRWTGWTDQDRAVTAVLSVDGRPVQAQKAALKAGPNTLEFDLDAGVTGTRSVEVTVAGSRVAGLLSVEGRASILVVRGPGTSSALGQALEAQGFPVVRSPGLPSPTGYQGFSAVVLDNVPAPGLGQAALAGLKDWVSAGGGLVVVGGDSPRKTCYPSAPTPAAGSSSPGRGFCSSSTTRGR